MPERAESVAHTPAIFAGHEDTFCHTPASINSRSTAAPTPKSTAIATT